MLQQFEKKEKRQQQKKHNFPLSCSCFVLSFLFFLFCNQTPTYTAFPLLCHRLPFSSWMEWQCSCRHSSQRTHDNIPYQLNSTWWELRTNECSCCYTIKFVIVTLVITIVIIQKNIYKGLEYETRDASWVVFVFK